MRSRPSLAASPVEAFLVTGDLEALPERWQALAASLPDPQVTERITEVLDSWTDPQAIANLLLYPRAIPAAQRVAVLLRGLRDDDEYLRLAAAAGVGSADVTTLPESARPALLGALLDLISTDDGPVARRAAASLGGLAVPHDAPDLVVLLRHPDETVRRNLYSALLPLLGAHTVRELIDDPDDVDPGDARAVADSCAVDGIDLDLRADEIRALPRLEHLPSRAEFGRQPASGENRDAGPGSNSPFSRTV